MIPMDMFSDLLVTPDGFQSSAEPPLQPDDTPPNDSPTGPLCEVCAAEIPWSGRGRRPKRCADHKTRTASNTASGGGYDPRPTRALDKRMQARLDAISGDLTQGGAELAGIIHPAMPVTAATMMINTPATADALVRLAQDHPRMLAGLEAVAKAAPWMTIGRFIAALALAVQVDMGHANPYGMGAEYLGVARAAQEVGWQPKPAKHKKGQSAEGDIVDNGFVVPQPPRFAMK